jgi:hypothetical protein
MNIALILLSAIFTFIASKTTKNLAAFIAFGALLPFFIVVFVGYLMNAAPEAQQIDTSRITDYLGAHIVEWVIADVFGVMIGAAVSAVTSRSSKN